MAKFLVFLYPDADGYTQEILVEADRLWINSNGAAIFEDDSKLDINTNTITDGGIVRAIKDWADIMRQDCQPYLHGFGEI